MSHTHRHCRHSVLALVTVVVVSFAMALMEVFKAGGEWKCTSDEGFEDFLAGQGVGWMQRKAAATLMSKPTLIFCTDGDAFGNYIKGNEDKTKMMFKFGETLDGKLPDGSPTKNTAEQVDDNTIKFTMTKEDGTVTTFTRTLADGVITSVMGSSKTDKTRTTKHTKA